MPRLQPHHRLPNYSRMIVLLDGAELTRINQLSAHISGLHEGIFKWKLQCLFWQMTFDFFPERPLFRFQNTFSLRMLNEVSIDFFFISNLRYMFLSSLRCLSNTDQLRFSRKRRCERWRLFKDFGGQSTQNQTEQWSLFHRRIFNWKKKINSSFAAEYYHRLPN